eukprot:scaffold3171_cov380-Prasinococcus_capsulatus_cf.AAC.5
MTNAIRATCPPQAPAAAAAPRSTRRQGTCAPRERRGCCGRPRIAPRSPSSRTSGRRLLAAAAAAAAAAASAAAAAANEAAAADDADADGRGWMQMSPRGRPCAGWAGAEDAAASARRPILSREGASLWRNRDVRLCCEDSASLAPPPGRPLARGLFGHAGRGNEGERVTRRYVSIRFDPSPLPAPLSSEIMRSCVPSHTDARITLLGEASPANEDSYPLNVEAAPSRWGMVIGWKEGKKCRILYLKIRRLRLQRMERSIASWYGLYIQWSRQRPALAPTVMPRYGPWTPGDAKAQSVER